ncbi:acyl-CoA dehydrogenase family protein [Bacillus sp. FJAT-42315]|uniref:acyl-CoA dehydrogenase family protein n=1 Tax=Bacillus sp. FJAT-42315 TaxID=2014077 RepID=UPI000C23F29E|nr:acyl-CoA dehydrogenase family protein [Bacillus sp. FJAT-42315]
MDLSLSKELEAYRLEVRHWLQENLPEKWGTPLYTKPQNEEEEAAFYRGWEKTLYSGGFNGITWPKKYGGQGKTTIHEIIFFEEAGKLNAPPEVNALGKSLFGPTLLVYGTEEQKKRYLEPLLKGEEMWCQGFSEPNAGSDLASLQTRAELDGDEWVINGQKVWTSGAQFADWCFVLARTDKEAPKHKGITFFLVPMNSKGVTVRPIVQMDKKAMFNEVFFDNVRIPKENFVGELNNGWQIAMTTLSFERGTMSLGRQAQFQKEFEQIVKLSKELTTADGSRIADTTYFRQKLAEIYSEIRIFRYHGLKTMSQLMNHNRLGPEASMQKVFWSSMHVKLGELAMEVLGKQAPYWGEDSLGKGKLHEIDFISRGETIYAGTTQVQKNIIAERVLQLPRG